MTRFETLGKMAQVADLLDGYEYLLSVVQPEKDLEKVFVGMEMDKIRLFRAKHGVKANPIMKPTDRNGTK